MSNTATVSYQWSEKGKQPKITQKQRNRYRKTLFGCVEPAIGKVVTSVEYKWKYGDFFKIFGKSKSPISESKSNNGSR